MKNQKNRYEIFLNFFLLSTILLSSIAVWGILVQAQIIPLKNNHYGITMLFLNIKDVEGSNGDTKTWLFNLVPFDGVRFDYQGPIFKGIAYYSEGQITRYESFEKGKIVEVMIIIRLGSKRIVEVYSAEEKLIRRHYYN